MRKRMKTIRRSHFWDAIWDSTKDALRQKAILIEKLKMRFLVKIMKDLGDEMQYKCII